MTFFYTMPTNADHPEFDVSNIEDALHDSEQISAIDELGEFVIIGADEVLERDGEEVNVIQIFRRDAASSELSHLHDVELHTGGEMDIEAIAVAREDRAVYVLGSHSMKRKKPKKKKYTQEKNRDRLKDTPGEPDRSVIYRVEIDDEGKGKPDDGISVMGAIAGEETLRLFTQIPSKENGVDIEGMAYNPEDGLLYLGFRGPVLLGEWAVVASVNYSEPTKLKYIYYLKLGGLGVRSIERVNGGFLLIAGPVGSGPAEYHLYYWNGEDGMVGNDVPDNEPKVLWHLANITPQNDSKPEGLMVIDEEGDNYNVLIVHDGAGKKKELFRRLTVPKPM
jgi:hypothetical protein